MTYRGRVQKGVIVLENADSLPDGTEVTVRPITSKSKKGNRTKGCRQPVTVRKELLKLAGKARDLPADAARNLDHYLYGHRKR